MRQRTAPISAGLAGLVTLLALVSAEQALGVPRYTAQYGQDCKLCHVNPTGGGLRDLYASQFIVPEELAARGWRDDEVALASPELAPGVTVGLDLRSLLQQQEGGTGTNLAMQGDFYVGAELGFGLLAYFEQGINGSGEIFGAWRGLPLDGYVKAGRFLPDYGWRFADHQMFNRRYLADVDGTDSPRGFHGSGLEAGISPGAVTVSASLLGGTESNGDSYAARILLHQVLGPVNAGIGGSVLRRDRPGDSRRAVGGIWYLAVGPLTWLGEIDETRQDDRLGNLVANELTLRIRRGLDLRGTYNFQDPDRDRRNGLRQRTGAGVAWMPIPVFNLLAMGNYWKIDEGDLVAGSSYLEGELVLHVFF
ncbi:hypothetical protein DRQ50_12670 [bacterium]|nr:MAG: hypothetical protein DRQ50_12670 [bacterium]